MTSQLSTQPTKTGKPAMENMTMKAANQLHCLFGSGVFSHVEVHKRTLGL